MRIEKVEIFSDATNMAIMRHPGRRFPGILIQGDTLYTLLWKADKACQKVGRGSPGYDEIKELRDVLSDFINHYKKTLAEHSIELPFSEV